MAYGHDYKSALKDYILFAGRMPLPPRYAFGYWWSRYWLYSDKEFRRLIDNFHRYDIPLDVLVVDMDWHYTEKAKGAGPDGHGTVNCFHLLKAFCVMSKHKT